jgi:nucleoid-associated protein YgaU
MLVLWAPAPAFAQTPAVNSALTFFDTVGDYFTSINTDNSIAANQNIELWTAAEYANGLNFADDLGVDYWFNSGVRLETVMPNSGVAGTLIDLQGGFGYSIVYYDVELSAGVKAKLANQFISASGGADRLAEPARSLSVPWSPSSSSTVAAPFADRKQTSVADAVMQSTVTNGLQFGLGGAPLARQTASKQPLEPEDLLSAPSLSATVLDIQVVMPGR